MKYCTHCKKTYSDKFNFCPICAEDLIDKKEYDERQSAELERRKVFEEVNKIDREYQALKKQVLAADVNSLYKDCFPSRLIAYSFFGKSLNKANEALNLLKDWADIVMFHKIHTPKSMYDELMVLSNKLIDNQNRIKERLVKVKEVASKLGLYIIRAANDMSLNYKNIDSYINGGTYCHYYRDLDSCVRFTVKKSLKSRISEDIFKGKESTIGPNYIHLKSEFDRLFAYQTMLYNVMQDLLNGYRMVGVDFLELEKGSFAYYAENYLKKI